MWDRRGVFAKTCGMGVGDVGGVYIYVYVDRRIR